MKKSIFAVLLACFIALGFAYGSGQGAKSLAGRTFDLNRQTLDLSRRNGDLSRQIGDISGELEDALFNPQKAADIQKRWADIRKDMAAIQKEAAVIQKKAADIEKKAANLSPKNRQTFDAELARLGGQLPKGLSASAPPSASRPSGILGGILNFFGIGGSKGGGSSGGGLFGGRGSKGGNDDSGGILGGIFGSGSSGRSSGGGNTALTGTVSISGTAQAGQTLTAVTSALGGSGAITYQWKRVNTRIGANSSTYAVTAADVGSAITVTITRAGYSGSVASPPTAAVTAANNTGGESINGWAAVPNKNHPFSDNISAIAYGNGIFVAGSNGGRMAYSSDCINWTAVANNPAGVTAVTAIAYGNGRFVVKGRSREIGYMAYSTDGINWTDVGETTFNKYRINDIAFGGGTFVAVGGWNTGTVVTSPDGVTWTPITRDKNSPFFMPGFDETKDLSYFDLDRVTYGGGKFIVWGRNYFGGDVEIMATSTDGRNWTALPEIRDKNSWIDTITYGGGKWVGVGTEGVKYSSDGVTWNAAATLGSDAEIPAELLTIKDFWFIKAIAYGNGRFVAGNGYSPAIENIAYSSDGITWTTISTLDSSWDGVKFGHGIMAIAFGDGRFVAVGGNKILYSTGN